MAGAAKPDLTGMLPPPADPSDPGYELGLARATLVVTKTIVGLRSDKLAEAALYVLTRQLVLGDGITILRRALRRYESAVTAWAHADEALDELQEQDEDEIAAEKSR
jgi:hypothetical protein